MDWRTHLPRTWLLGVSTLVVALAGAGAGAEPSSPPAKAGPSPGQVLMQVATLRRGPPQLQERATGGEPARTLAPYFVVAGEGEGERLPLEETRADASIAGPIARVRVTQVFRNRGQKPIEAVYVFPASTRAAVHGMRIKIGERTVEARIDRRAKAREDYEVARTEGKRAALLEEERPNVFTMHVANIMPGDRIVAELDYSELIVPEQGIYELVYPTVVGPRYGGALPLSLSKGQGERSQEDGWIANPTLTEGQGAPYRFGFAAHLESAIPVKELSSPSHELAVSWRSPRSVDLAVKGEDGGNKDVVLRWRLAGDAVEAGVLLFPGDDGDGWFLATVEPPARVRPEAIPPREYVFVLDVSGSMHGFPLDTAKSLMRSLLPRLRPVDRFNIVFFSGGSYVLAPGGSLAATPENVRRALETYDRQTGGGGTELLRALQTAYDLPRADKRIARSVVVVTDGYVGVEAQAFRLVRERLPEASCFAFGIGSAVNRALIEALARAGQGEPTIVLSPRDAAPAAARLERIIAAPVLSQLRYEAQGLDARDVLPGALPDLLAERPVTLLGRYHGAPQGKIVLTGQSATGAFRRELDLSGAVPRQENAPLRVLWARRWVDLLLDEQHLGAAQELEDAITELGLAHRILTPYTSFVAVDSEVVNRGGDGQTVKQPLPLPEGVSNLAVGGELARRKGDSATVHGYFGSAQGGAGAPLPAPSTAPQRLAASESKVAPKAPEKERASLEDRDEKSEAPTLILIVRDSQTGLSGIEGVREAVRSALAKLAGEGMRGEVELKLTLDGSGAVIKVQVLRAPDAAARSKLEQALRGIRSGAKPAGAATYQVTAKLG